MAYTDEYGITHVSAIDNVDGWTQAHVAECPACRGRFSSSKIPYTQEEWDAYVELRGKKPPKQVFAYDDLYYNEPGPVDCQLCGVKVFNTDKHLEWHNKLGV